METRILGYGALGALIIADIGLVGLSLRNPTPSSAAEVTVVTAPATPDTSSSPSPTENSGPRPNTADPAQIVATQGSNIVATFPGACDGSRASGSWSSDGGATWTELPEPNSVVGRALFTSNSTVAMVAANENCENTSLYRSTLPPAWSAGGSTGEVWYALPGSPSILGTPSGRTESPCEVTVSLVPSASATAVLLCGDGRIYRTTDNGQSWTNNGALPEGRAIAGDVNATLVGLVASAECDGLYVGRSADVGETWTVGQCLTPFSTSSPPGIAVDGNRVVAIDANNATYVSDDLGVSFDKVSG